MADPAPNGPPPRSPESADWRFAIIVLVILLIAVLVTSIILYVRDSTIPEGFGNLGAGLTGALIVIIGKRMI
jgi:hypothetical protein